MSERYNIDNDLIPDRELEVRFEQIREYYGKGGRPFLLIRMKVREDVNENGSYKGREIVAFFNQEKGTNRYKKWEITALANTQDYAKVKEALNNNFTIEQLSVFLVGKNARVYVVIETNEQGVKNKVKKFMKTHYVPVEKKPAPQVVEEDDDIVLDDDFYKDLPF